MKVVFTVRLNKGEGYLEECIPQVVDAASILNNVREGEVNQVRARAISEILIRLQSDVCLNLASATATRRCSSASAFSSEYGVLSIYTVLC